jgi:CheY-like chemotaxis protein
MRVLVVDDSLDTARMMRVLLRGQGYEVKLAFTGREAIEAAEGFRPGVVLLDLALPDMSGEEVAAELRRAEGFEGTAFVAVSGYASDQAPTTFDGHFVKPVDHDALNKFLARRACEQAPPRRDGPLAMT